MQSANENPAQKVRGTAALYKHKHISHVNRNAKPYQPYQTYQKYPNPNTNTKTPISARICIPYLVVTKKLAKHTIQAWKDASNPSGSQIPATVHTPMAKHCSTTKEKKCSKISTARGRTS